MNGYPVFQCSVLTPLSQISQYLDVYLPDQFDTTKRQGEEMERLKVENNRIAEENINLKYKFKNEYLLLFQMESAQEEQHDEIMRMKREMQKICEENRSLKAQLAERDQRDAADIKKLTEKMKALKDENQSLKAKLSGKKIFFSLDEWMKNDIEEMRSSTADLNEKLMELYGVIWNKRLDSEWSSNTAETKKINKKVHKLKTLCEKVSKGVQERNKKLIKKIKKTLKGKQSLVTRTSEAENIITIENFLGSFKMGSGDDSVPLSFSIKKANEKGYYEDCRDYSLRTYKFSWIPDGIERDSCRASIEGNRLKIEQHANTWSYVIKGDEMVYKGCKKSGHYTRQ